MGDDLPRCARAHSPSNASRLRCPSRQRNNMARANSCRDCRTPRYSLSCFRPTRLQFTARRRRQHGALHHRHRRIQQCPIPRPGRTTTHVSAHEETLSRTELLQAVQFAGVLEAISRRRAAGSDLGRRPLKISESQLNNSAPLVAADVPVAEVAARTRPRRSTSVPSPARSWESSPSRPERVAPARSGQLPSSPHWPSGWQRCAAGTCSVDDSMAGLRQPETPHGCGRRRRTPSPTAPGWPSDRTPSCVTVTGTRWWADLSASAGLYRGRGIPRCVPLA